MAHGGGGGGGGGNIGGVQSHARYHGGGGGAPPGEAPGARHVLITLPAGFRPNRELVFKAPGGHCSVQVPPDLQAGDSLQVALPHVEQKIAILNAYFGRDDEPYPKSGGPGALGRAYMKIASSVIDHAASELGIKAKLDVKHNNGRARNLADKVDMCLEHILETGQMLPNPELQSIACEEVQLSMCRNRSVATAVAVPIQPPSMQRRVEAVPFVGPPTSSHNGIYLSGPGLCGFVISSITAVDDRTLEWYACAPCFFCLPFDLVE